MSDNKKLLPDRVSKALRVLVLRIGGILLFAIGICFAIALIFHNPYLDGFMVTSGFGSQSLIGNIVSFFRYGIGFIPSLFLFLCLIKAGISVLMGWNDAPEYNIIRGFIAISLGAAGLGAIAPAMTLGEWSGQLLQQI